MGTVDVDSHQRCLVWVRRAHTLNETRTGFEVPEYPVLLLDAYRAFPVLYQKSIQDFEEYGTALHQGRYWSLRGPKGKECLGCYIVPDVSCLNIKNVAPKNIVESIMLLKQLGYSRLSK